jgi:selenophosphate synthetase-related protein
VSRRDATRGIVPPALVDAPAPAHLMDELIALGRARVMAAGSAPRPPAWPWPPASGPAPVVELAPLPHEPQDPVAVLLRMLAARERAGGGGGEAVLVCLNEPRLALAVAVRHTTRDEADSDGWAGPQAALCEAVRDLAALGPRPLVAAHRFGANPDGPGGGSGAAVKAACAALSVPLSERESAAGSASGGVDGMVGVVGRLEEGRQPIDAGFSGYGDFVVLIGPLKASIGGSEYLAVEHGRTGGRRRVVDLERERSAVDLVHEANAAGLLRSARGVAGGGLLVALAECCLRTGVGTRCLSLRPDPGSRLDAYLFGEAPGRFVVSARAADTAALQRLAARHGVQAHVLGLVGGDRLEFDGQLAVSLPKLREAWRGTAVGLPSSAAARTLTDPPARGVPVASGRVITLVIPSSRRPLPEPA